MGCSCNGCPEDDIADGVMTIVEVPDGVTMDCCGTAALPPPQPAMPRKRQKTATVRAPHFVNRLLPSAFPSLQRFSKATRRTNPSVNSGITRCPETGVRRMGIESGSTAPPLVATVTVNGEGAAIGDGHARRHMTRRAERRAAANQANPSAVARPGCQLQLGS